jgi:Domain of unknown function (DUF4224)
VFLTYEEIVTLTKKRRHAAQARALKNMKPDPIPYRTRSDGSLIVLRIHVETPPAVKLPAEPQLRLDA